MGYLGTFGTPREAHEDTFTFLGEDFRIHPDFTDLGLADFMMQAADIDESDEPAAMNLVRDQLTGIVHPDDWRRFWALCREKRQMYIDLMELMKSLVQALSGRPTQRRSDSLSGRRKTKTRSKGNSSGRAAAGGPAKVQTVVRRLETAGRPDLALAVVEADEQRRTG